MKTDDGRANRMPMLARIVHGPLPHPEFGWRQELEDRVISATVKAYNGVQLVSDCACGHPHAVVTVGSAIVSDICLGTVIWPGATVTITGLPDG